MKSTKALVLLALLISLSGCGVYSFSGTSIDYNQIKTLSIANFLNEIGSGPPNMAQNFTEGLKDYFQRRTKLELIQRQGDLQFEGSISDYRVNPQAISASGSSTRADGTGLMRLTIVVQVVFTNSVEEEASFQRPFTFYADYDPSTTTLNAVEEDLVQEIFDALYFDIFQAAVAQW
ncbi:LPS assembly lipoprotein LptE [Roseivirga sp.]|uniref:LPS assembly lipoprotein LptE n=1 Tax=Roseivirga sp. TaxID=1964215 RepID=UPI003B515C2D